VQLQLAADLCTAHGETRRTRSFRLAAVSGEIQRKRDEDRKYDVPVKSVCFANKRTSRANEQREETGRDCSSYFRETIHAELRVVESVFVLDQ